MPNTKIFIIPTTTYRFV